MQTLRKYMRHIMWIVAIAFVATIIFSWGMGGFKKRGVPTESGLVGVVNGRKIMYQEFAAALDEEYKRVRETENVEELSEYQRGSIRDQVWNNMIREIVMADEVKKLGVKVTPEEIAFYVRNNPPPDVRSSQQFLTDGKFDPMKWEQALRDPRNINGVLSMENYYRMSIPLQKLQQQILATVRISDGEVEEAYRRNNEKVNVKYVLFDPADVPQSGIHVGEKEMKAYYDKHKKDFFEPERRKIQYILFPIKPTPADSAQTRAEAADLMDQLRGGADFAQLARENSEDKGSATNGGDLGFFGRGSMVKPFDDAAFSAKVGQVVGPVETVFGLHIIKVMARKQEAGQTQVQARHILLTFKTSPETQDAVQERAQYLLEEIEKSKGKRFAELAKEEKMEIRETDWFPKGGFITGLGMASRVNALAFLQKKNWISPVLQLDKNLILFRISSIRQEMFRPFAEAKTSILGTLAQEKQMEEAGRRCETFKKKITNPQDFEKAALSDSLPVNETGYFSMNAAVPRIGRDAQFIGAAFRLKKGECSEPVKGTRGWFLLLAVDRIPIDPAALGREKTTLRENLLTEKQNQAYSFWMRRLIEKAKIQDYRNHYF
ncbi:MAG TPA: peptidylprolyl isomerase [bacterium]